MKLDEYRTTINSIDLSILHLIKSRQQAALGLGRYKVKNNLPILDRKRESELKQRNMKLAKSIGVSEDLALDFSKILMKHSKILQQNLLERKSV